MTKNVSSKNWLKGPEFLPANVRTWLENFLPVDRFFDDEFIKSAWVPAVNIIDNKENYEIEVAAPGFKKEDFEVKVDNGMLVIAAEHKMKKEEKEVNYTRKEFGYATFRRTFALPENVNEEAISAKYTDGILHLRMKKVEVPEATENFKKIEIA